MIEFFIVSLFGLAVLLYFYLIGAAALSAANITPKLDSKLFAALVIPSGLLCASIAFSALLISGLVHFSGVFVATSAAAAVSLLFWKRNPVSFQRPERAVALIVAVVSMLCGALILLRFTPSGDEPNLFWTIYYLSNITPGDSPQGIMQAQFLMHGGDSLAEFATFSIFDRPFMGGILTAGVMCAAGQCPSVPMYFSVTHFQQLIYISTWIWINASTLFSLNLLVGTVNNSRRVLLVALLAISPFFLGNVIGLWPKPIALHFFVAGLYLLIWRRDLLPLGLTMVAAAFFLHGSFIWPMIASLGLFGLYAVSKRAVSEAAQSFAVMIAVPALWFGSQAASGISSPLQLYYLYNSGVQEAFATPASELIERFYSVTSIGSLSALPVVNLIKFLLPFDVIKWIDAYDVSGATILSLSNALLSNSYNRPVFFAGFSLAAVAIMGLIKGWRSTWLLMFAIVALLAAPLVPGAALYRKADHFLATIQLTSIIPILLAIAVMMRADFSTQRFVIVSATLACMIGRAHV